MKIMKKFLSLLLALVMALSLVACGGGQTDGTNPDSIADEMTSEDGKYEICLLYTSPSPRDS